MVRPLPPVLLTRALHPVLDGAQLLAAACGAQRILVCIPTGRDGTAETVNRARRHSGDADSLSKRQPLDEEISWPDTHAPGTEVPQCFVGTTH